MEKTRWYKDMVFYQIWPRSFKDGDGDGMGDLWGVYEKLDYIKSLGCDGIWFSPLYPSPGIDCGYDISDYQAIDALFGNMEDMEVLFAEAKKRDIRILMDLVLNHSSDEHPWFIEAKKSKDNPYHDYYVWRDGVEGEYPNDMRATFGGPAWEWVPELGQYYFHQFAIKQPDLNWENEKLREELYSMIRWWIDKGAGGFRLDVIDQIANDIAKLFSTKYMGKIQNNKSGRVSLWADIVAHHKQLEAITAIENFDSSLVTVEQGATKKSVIVTDAVKVINSMSQLYMTVVIE